MDAIDVYYHPLFLKHETGEHPENKQRLVVAVQTLEGSALDLDWVTPEPAVSADVERVHTPEYVETVRRVAAQGGGWLDWDTAISPDSYDAALLAAGAGIMAVDRGVEDGALAFMLVRPPGHHARPSQGMGFCLFNNIAVAAAHAVDVLGLERVLIVDWDVHHGNGTNDAFYDDPRVLFFSIHEGNHYPGTGLASEVGSGDGAGFTINVPLRAGGGDGAILASFESLFLPVARSFKPQLILVSAGYDGQRGDPLGELRYSETAFQWMAARLRSLALEVGGAGPLPFLEGGYVPSMMATSIVATLRGVLGEQPDFETTVLDSERQDVQRAVEAVRPYWKDAL
ncbi:MAG: histone deacetylase [Actinobacteria bacterium]|nr:histone deacetylase [Actinomycetota bacterium]